MQRRSGTWLAFLPHWNVVTQPIGALVFVVAAFAETNRVPFDLAEAEAELVAGYHTEYSSLSFAAFYMSEYIHMTVAAALITLLYFGGWNLPWIDVPLTGWPGALLSMTVFAGKGGVLSVVLRLGAVDRPPFPVRPTDGAGLEGHDAAGSRSTSCGSGSRSPSGTCRDRRW